MHAQILFTLAFGVPENGVFDRTNVFAIASLDPIPNGELVAGLMVSVWPVELHLDFRLERPAVYRDGHGDAS
jgi:hypothetical protein